MLSFDEVWKEIKIKMKRNEILIDLYNQTEFFLSDYIRTRKPEKHILQKKVNEFLRIYGNTTLNKAGIILSLSWWESHGTEDWKRKGSFQYWFNNIKKTLNKVKKGQPITINVDCYDFYDDGTEMFFNLNFELETTVL